MGNGEGARGDFEEMRGEGKLDRVPHHTLVINSSVGVMLVGGQGTRASSKMDAM